MVAKNHVEELYQVRKSFDKSGDEKLNRILDNIKQNCDSLDSQKLTQSFNQLKEHIESTYGYKFESQKMYVYDKLDLPLVMNYATNILILGVILYYKIYPKPGSDTGQVRSFH
jgi:hypothetical protein